jgi:hypothetical protein
MNVDIKNWLPKFLTEFHAIYMKPKGYKKKGRTFTQCGDDFDIIINFQGDKWNYSGTTPWWVILNFGVYFHSLDKPITSMYIRNTHWAARPTEIDLPCSWDYDTNTDKSQLAKNIYDVIQKSENYFKQEIEVIRYKSIERLERDKKIHGI